MEPERGRADEGQESGQNEKIAVGHIDEAHDAEHQGEPQRHAGVQPAQKQAVQRARTNEEKIHAALLEMRSAAPGNCIRYGCSLRA